MSWSVLLDYTLQLEQINLKLYNDKLTYLADVQQAASVQNENEASVTERNGNTDGDAPSYSKSLAWQLEDMELAG